MVRVEDIADVAQGLSTFGRGAGSRPGEWSLRLVESGNIRDICWVYLDGLREIEVAQNMSTERHLLRPYDVLVSARAGYVQAALVPPDVSRTVASVTLLVVRPHEPESGLGHFLWYFLSSTLGRAQLNKQLTVSSTVTSLSARNLREVELTVPAPPELDQIARLVEASEEAYALTVEAARLRRDALRDSIISGIEATRTSTI